MFRAVGLPLCLYLYTDCRCSDSKPVRSTAIPDAVTPIEVTDSDDAASPGFVNMMWKGKFTVHLASMHLMMRIGRQIPGNHIRRHRVLPDLGDAIH